MASVSPFKNITGDGLYGHYVVQDRPDMVSAVCTEKPGYWMLAVAKSPGKTKLATKLMQYAKRLVSEGFGTVDGIVNLEVTDLKAAGMRIGDAKFFMHKIPSRDT